MSNRRGRLLRILAVLIFVALAALPITLTARANVVLGQIQTAGLYAPATSIFSLRSSNTAGVADIRFQFGPPGVGWIPIVGDWTGRGIKTPGLYNPATGFFYLRNSNSTGVADITFQFGPGGLGWIPIVGDWDGDGVDTIGLYAPSTGFFYLRNTNSTGVADVTFQFGPRGLGWTPLVGDWNGDGVATIGLYAPNTGFFYLRNTNSTGVADVTFQFGPGGAGWVARAGDWDGNGTSTIGLYNPTTATFFLRNSNTTGTADVTFAYGPPGAGWIPLDGTWMRRIPLIDMGMGRYLGMFSGELYPGGSNSIPAAHASIGIARGNAVQPLDTNGNPSPSGRYVMLSIGMSNTADEFCCASWTFIGQATADPTVNHTTLVIVNGAADGRPAGSWDQPTDPRYDEIRDTLLTPQGLSERQVQAAWVKVANPDPVMSLPSASADAYRLQTQLGDIVRALRTRYPNIRQVFISSRIYAGYATVTLNPEPYAYEYGFSVKWVVQAQIDQMQHGGVIVDPRAGDLNYNTVAPWIAWGPYLWADGTNPRSDGLIWSPTDFRPTDGTHPSMSGETKVANMLMTFFKGSSMTRCWFVVGATCP